MSHTLRSNEALEHAAASTGAARDYHLRVAQVEATLAVAEQQRVNTLIALARVESENESTPTDALDAIYRKESEQRSPYVSVEVLRTRDEIKHVLGL